MDIKDILARCDHTLLRTDCTAAEIRALCDDAIRFGCASVCIPPAHVAGAKRYVNGQMKICTVIGFPNGYSTTAAKCRETEEALRGGAAAEMPVLLQRHLGSGGMSVVRETEPRGGEISGDAVDAHAVLAVRCDRDVDHRIVEPRPGGVGLADGRVLRQVDDPVMLARKVEFGLRAQHAAALHAADLPDALFEKSAHGEETPVRMGEILGYAHKK